MQQPDYTNLRVTNDIIKLARNYAHFRAELGNLVQASNELQYGKHLSDDLMVEEIELSAENISVRAEVSINLLNVIQKKITTFLKYMEIYKRRK